jgi:NADH-quinone oxidoreductase subunit M
MTQELLLQLPLNLLVGWPLFGFFLLLLLPKRWSPATFKREALILSLVPLLVAGYLAALSVSVGWGEAGAPFTVFAPWFSVGDLRVLYALYVDGLSLPLILLASLLTTLAIGYSDVQERAKEYYALFLLLEAGVLGTLLAADFFLFYVFWEITLVPMYFLIGIWGSADREHAGIKFFLFALAGSVAMLLSIIWLYLAVPEKTLLFMRIPSGPGEHYASLLDQGVQAGRSAPVAGILAWWGIFLALAVRIPAWPLHTWLPDAHQEAPTAGSVLLSGVLPAVGGYGIFRILLPVLPEQSFAMRDALLWMGVMGAVYGALVATAQTDFKRLIAYASVSQMGYVLLGAASGAAILNPDFLPTDAQLRAAQTAVSGALYQMPTHGLLVSGLFLLAGTLHDRTHTRDLSSFGGLGETLPEYAGWLRFFAFGSLGLPGLAGFVAPLLVLVGTFQMGDEYRWATALAALGGVITAAFLLWTLQRVLHGPLNLRWAKIPDLVARERFPLAVLGALALLFGLLPGLLLPSMQGYLDQLQELSLALGRMRGL